LRGRDRRTVLGAAETVARLLYSKNHYSRKRNRPKPTAFDPSPYNELSTIHVTGLEEEQIWDVSVNALGDQRGRGMIYGRADVPVQELHMHRLHAVRDDDPFDRHTLVLGWPEIEIPDQRKERWLEICLALSQAESVKLSIPATPITRDRRPMKP
jgi:hypothetical protein